MILVILKMNYLTKLLLEDSQFRPAVVQLLEQFLLAAEPSKLIVLTKVLKGFLNLDMD
jgi:hypothetical protein